MAGNGIAVPGISLALAGDVMLGRVVNEVLCRRGPEFVWGDTLSRLSTADLTVVNLECAVAREGKGSAWSRWPKTFHFRAGPVAVDALKLAGIDCALLANNHVLDYEVEGLLETLNLLEAAGIEHAGAGRDLKEAMRPVVLEAAGLRVGVVAFTDNEPGWAATADAPGTNWTRISLEDRSLLPVRESLAAARSNDARLVIFSAHWGPNMVERPTPIFRDFAHAVIEAGADLFFGHSAHVFQGIEIYRGRPIIYDAGDFVDDYAVDQRLRNDRGLLFIAHVDGQAGEQPAPVHRLELLPVEISGCQVNLAAGQEWAAIAARIGQLCAEMGTTVREVGGRLWVDVSP